MNTLAKYVRPRGTTHLTFSSVVNLGTGNASIAVHIDCENILVISYEWMKANHRSAVETIAKFMRYDLTPSEVSSIVDQTTFERMKVNPAANMSWTDSVRLAANTAFMRKGKVGDWRNYFTDEQSAKMDEEIRKTLAGTGLEFKFS